MHKRKDVRDWFDRSFKKHWPKISPFLVGPKFLRDEMEKLLSLFYKGNLDGISIKKLKENRKSIEDWLEVTFNMKMNKSYSR